MSDKEKTMRCVDCAYYGGMAMDCDFGQCECRINGGVVYDEGFCRMFYDFGLAFKILENSREKK